MASIQKRVRNGKTTYSVNYRDPTGRGRRKVFDRARDAERWLHENETSKLNRAWVDPAAGNDRFGGWGERWYATTAALRPTTRHDYRALLDNQVLPAFAAARLIDIDALAVREWLAGRSAAVCRPSGPARPTRCSPRSSMRRSTAVGWPATSPPGLSSPRCSGARWASWTPSRSSSSPTPSTRGIRRWCGSPRRHRKSPAGWSGAASRPMRPAPCGCLGRWQPKSAPTSPTGPTAPRTWCSPRRSAGRCDSPSSSRLLQARRPGGGAPGHAAVLRPSAHGREPAHTRGRQRQGGAEAARSRHREHHPGHLRPPVPRRAGPACRAAGGRARPGACGAAGRRSVAPASPRSRFAPRRCR
jgi:hypothetical protein